MHIVVAGITTTCCSVPILFLPIEKEPGGCYHYKLLVIITAGAWTGKLVEGTGLTLPLQVLS